MRCKQFVAFYLGKKLICWLYDFSHSEELPKETAKYVAYQKVDFVKALCLDSYKNRNSGNRNANNKILTFLFNLYLYMSLLFLE